MASNKEYKEWLDITTFNDLANGYRLYQERHTGETMKVNTDGSGCTYG